jgi:serine/threonine protein kinase
LAYLHSQNPPIIHQDIKPDNILIANNGDFVITDFGISKQVRSTLRKSVMKLNSAGAIAYMGPERFLANYTSIKSSDIWSLGATIYELAEGTLPFNGYGGSFLNHGAETPNLSEIFSDELNKLMQACLKKDPWDRPIAEELAVYANSKIKGINIETPNWMKNQENEPLPTPPSPILPTENNPKEKDDDTGNASHKKSNALSLFMTISIGLIMGAIVRLVMWLM